ncbi:MAG: tail fiber protein [Verrucomicrobiales bacterium]|nr:tail fiber protein [Verrucomicrobiales bacterium]
MSEPFLAEIIMFGGNFAPRSWALCDGQILPINQNQSLFSLLGTTYGGDGRTTFALPDMRGRIPVHAGGVAGLSDRRLGERGGSEQNTILVQHMPTHTHNPVSTASVPIGAGVGEDDANPTGRVAGLSGDGNVYANVGSVDMGTTVKSVPPTIAETGNGSPVNNLQPCAVVNFIIATFGLFPSRN